MEFSDPQLEIISSTAQINLFLAGLGSGKTFMIGARNLIFTINYPHVRGFIGANTYQQLAKSTLVGVFKFWGMCGLVRDVDYVVNKQPPEGFKIIGERLEKYDHTISFKNGKLYFLGSLENYDAIAGQEFAHADIDETKDSPEEGVKDVIIPRLRQLGMWIDKRGNIITDMDLALQEGYDGFNPLNIYTSPGKCEWLYEYFDFYKHEEEIAATIFSKTNYFRKRFGDKFMVISSSYHNEHNLPKGYIEKKIIEPNAHNEEKINMNLYGSPFAKTGSEYYNQFIRMVHVRDVEMPAEANTQLGFDFNRNPYITNGLYKIWYKKDVQRWHVHKFDEVCLPGPNNTTEHLSERIITLYEPMFDNGIIYYGDFSGDNKRTNSMETDWDVIARKFKRWIGNTSNRVIVNQPVVKRKEFMNRIFWGTTPKDGTIVQNSLPIDFTISPKCINTIKDCEFLMEAPDGGKLKKKNKEGHEILGHCSDEMEYVFTSAFNQYFKPKK